MASYDIQPLQLRIHDILLALYKVCKEHYQRHYFWAGTMLGVVRHKGYIPWDDDIDMIMLREDYGRLMPLADEFEHTYFLQNVYILFLIILIAMRSCVIPSATSSFLTLL